MYQFFNKYINPLLGYELFNTEPDPIVITIRLNGYIKNYPVAKTH